MFFCLATSSANSWRRALVVGKLVVVELLTSRSCRRQNCCRQTIVIALLLLANLPSSNSCRRALDVGKLLASANSWRWQTLCLCALVVGELLASANSWRWQTRLCCALVVGKLLVIGEIAIFSKLRSPRNHALVVCKLVALELLLLLKPRSCSRCASVTCLGLVTSWEW